MSILKIYWIRIKKLPQYFMCLTIPWWLACSCMYICIYLFIYSKYSGKVCKQHFVCSTASSTSARMLSVFKGCLFIQEVKMYSNNISTRSECGDSWQADLQVEAGALRHGGEGRDGRHRGEGTHQHKDTPAVELVGRAHLETPAYVRRKRGGRCQRKQELRGSCKTWIGCTRSFFY